MMGQLTARFSEAGRQIAMTGFGLALIASAILIGVSGLTDTYRLTVEPGVDNEYASEQAKQIEIETLEPDSRATVVEAIESGDVWTADPVSQFGYPPGRNTGGQWHVVAYQGEEFLLKAAQVVRPQTLLATGYQVSAGLAGGGLVLVAALLRLSVLRSRDETATRGRFLTDWLPATTYVWLLPAVILPSAWVIQVEVWRLIGKGRPRIVFLAMVGVATLLVTVLSAGFVRFFDVDKDAFGVVGALGPVLWVVCVLIVAGLPDILPGKLVIPLLATILAMWLGLLFAWRLWA